MTFLIFLVLLEYNSLSVFIFSLPIIATSCAATSRRVLAD